MWPDDFPYLVCTCLAHQAVCFGSKYTCKFACLCLVSLRNTLVNYSCSKFNLCNLRSVRGEKGKRSVRSEKGKRSVRSEKGKWSVRSEKGKWSVRSEKGKRA